MYFSDTSAEYCSHPSAAPSRFRAQVLPWVWAAVVLVCAAALCGCASQSPTLSSTLTESQQQRASLLTLYSQGISRVERGELADAASVFSRMLQRDPRSDQAAAKLAGCYIGLDEVAQGVAEFTRLTERDPHSYPLRRWLALLLKLDGRNEQAEANYKRAIRLRPDAAEPYIELAVIMLGQGRDADAVELLERAESAVGVNYDMMALRAGIHSKMADSGTSGSNAESFAESIAPLREDYGDNPAMLEFIGDLLARMDLAARALEFYRAAVETGSARSEVYLKGTMLELSHDPEADSSMLADGLARFPSQPELLVLRGRLHFEQADYRAAVRDFDRVDSLLREDKAKKATRFFLVQYSLAHQLNGDAERALEIVERVGASDAAFLQRYFVYALQILPDNEHPQVLEMLQMLAESHPESHIVPIYIGHYHNLQSDYAEAARNFRTALDRLPTGVGNNLEVPMRFWYGAALERQGLIDDAAEQFQRCIGLDPEHAEAHNYLAYMWAAADLNLERARQLIQRALKIDPDNGAYLDTLGWIDYRQGRYGEALKNLERAQRLVPDDPTVQEHIGDTHAALGDFESAIRCWRRALKLDPGNTAVAKKIDETAPQPLESAE